MIVNWKEADLKHAIEKLFNHIKPEGVNEVKFTIRPSEIHKDTWLFNLTLIIPDDSQFFQMDYAERAFFKLSMKEYYINNLYGFLGIRASIEHINFQSESYIAYNETNRQMEALEKLKNLIM